MNSKHRLNEKLTDIRNLVDMINEPGFKHHLWKFHLQG